MHHGVGPHREHQARSGGRGSEAKCVNTCVGRVNRLKTGCFEQFQQALGQRAILSSGGWPSEVRRAGDPGWSRA